MMVSGLAGRFGVTTASRVVKPSLLFVSALQKAAPAGPDFEPMTRSMCAISLPSPTSDSPRKKSAAMERAPVLRMVESGTWSGSEYTESGRASVVRRDVQARKPDEYIKKRPGPALLVETPAFPRRAAGNVAAPLSRQRGGA